MQLQQLGLPDYGYSPSSSNASAGSAGSGTVTGSAATAASVVSSASELSDVRESETLDIQMKDGTEVTLRLRAHEASLATTQTQADGSTSTAAALLASGGMQVEVSGNPSAADLDAINSVVSQVDSLANQFFAGDVQDAFAAAASLRLDASHIAALGLQLTYGGTLIQQATANGGAAAATAAAASPSAQQIIINFVQQAMTKLARGNAATDQVSSRWKVKLLAQALPAYAQAAQAAAQAGTAQPGAARSNAAQTAAPTGAGPTTPAVPATYGPTSALATAPAAAPSLQAARLAAATLIRSAQ